jgi:hypothetical protein
MNEHFKSLKSRGFGALLITASGLILFLLFGLPIISKGLITVYELTFKCLIATLVIGSFIWFWTSTFYTIDRESLIIKSGPFHWIISIQDIKAIRTNQNTIGGIIKPTLSFKCIEIDYGKFKTISISPVNQDRFIKILKDFNKTIEIKNYA